MTLAQFKRLFAMETLAPQAAPPAELASMLATLCWYENWLGPYHPRTLSLMAQVGDVCSKAQEFAIARPLLERVVRDGDRHLGRAHELRLEAMTALRDLLLAMNEFESAVRIQGEILECQAERFGADHPRAQAARENLATICLRHADSGLARTM